MAIDLEALRGEIEGYFAQSSLTPFHGVPNSEDRLAVYWDTQREPDFRVFLRAAERAGVRLVVMHQEQFLLAEIDQVREELEATTLSREEKRALENRIQEVQKFEGFTARLELSFTLDGQNYVYQVAADWYSTWDDILLEIEAATEEGSEELDDNSMSGYYSAN